VLNGEEGGRRMISLRTDSSVLRHLVMQDGPQFIASCCTFIRDGKIDNCLFGYPLPITGENRNLYATDHLNPVLYFVLIFAVPVARLFSVYGAASDCNVRKNLCSLSSV